MSSNEQITHTPTRALNDIQLELADLASDLIANGGEQEEVEALLTSLVGHRYYGYYKLFSTPEEARKHTQEAIEKHADWYWDRLSAGWPKDRPAADEPKPTTVTELIHLALRERLRAAFEEFMTNINLGNSHCVTDLFLLESALNAHNSGAAETLVESFLIDLDAEERTLAAELLKQKTGAN